MPKTALAFSNHSLGNYKSSDDIDAGDSPTSPAWDLQLDSKQYFPKRTPRLSFRKTPAASSWSIPENLEVYDTARRKNEDSLTNAGLLGSEDDPLQDLILRFKTSLPIQYQNLANRLFTLLEYSKEEDPTGPGIVLGSLQTFYDFLELHAKLKVPEITLTPENNIYASWHVGKERRFGIHFLPNRSVRFVLFAPNDKHPNLPIRLYGTATADVLIKTVAPHGVWNWVAK